MVARNVIICILAASVRNADKASECIAHIWYSAFIRQADLDLLNAHVLPLVQDVWARIKDKSSANLHSKTWKLMNCSLSLVLEKETWRLLLSCLTVRRELTLQQAQASRSAITRSIEHRDDLDRYTVQQLPVHRVSRQIFVDDGILLPFGYSRKAFVIPNP